MSNQCFGPHAHKRALERYGLDLTASEMREIIKDCQSGKALLGRTNEHGHTYLARFRGDIVVPVLNGAKDFIITFMERDHFVSRQSLRFHQKTGTAKQKSGNCRFPRRDDYRRKKITIADAQEEL